MRNYGWPCYEGPANAARPTTARTSTAARRSTTEGGATSRRTSPTAPGTIVPGETCSTDGVGDLRRALLQRRPVPGRVPGRVVLQRLRAQLHLGRATRARTACRTCRTRETFASDATDPSWLTQGPDGALWYADISAAACSGSRPSTRTRSRGSPPRREEGPAPLAVAFDGTGSLDPEDEARDVRVGPRRRRRVRRLHRRSTPHATRTRNPGVETVRLQVTRRRRPRRHGDQDDHGRQPPPTVTIGDDRVAVGGRRRASGSPAPPATAGRRCPLGAHLVAAPAPLRAHGPERLPHARHPGLRRGRLGSFVAPDHEYPSHLRADR